MLQRWRHRGWKFLQPHGPSSNSDSDGGPGGSAEAGGASGDLGSSCGRGSAPWASEDAAETCTWDGDDDDRRRDVSGLQGTKAGFSMPWAPFMIRLGSPDSGAAEARGSQVPRWLRPRAGDSAPVREDAASLPSDAAALGLPAQFAAPHLWPLGPAGMQE